MRMKSRQNRGAMIDAHVPSRLPKLSPWIVLAGIVAALPLAGAEVVQLPAFRPGMWKFERTVETRTGGAPTTFSNTKCADPTAEMKKRNALFLSQKCVIAPLQREGNLYTFSAQCTVQGKTVNSLTLLTVDSPTAYHLQINSHGEGPATKEAVVATRVGDCKK
jgi:hypothetical protein